MLFTRLILYDENIHLSVQKALCIGYLLKSVNIPYHKPNKYSIDVYDKRIILTSLPQLSVEKADIPSNGGAIGLEISGLGAEI